jgi:hypothetical protein
MRTILGRDRQAVDEGAHLGGTQALAARQRLQLLVGFRHRVAAHHRLDRLGQHLPVGVEVRQQARGVELQLADAFQRGLVGDQALCEGAAEIAQHRRVREVALPARDRQLLDQVAEQRVGEAEVAFGVLEVDRVHLVRHRRRADFAGPGALAEVADRDVAPDVAREVEQDRVEARHRREQFGEAVVRLDLRGVGVPVEPERGHEARAFASQSTVGIGRQMRVVVADRAVDLAEQAHAGDLPALAVQAIGDVRELLAHRRRRGGLAVRAREQRMMRSIAGSMTSARAAFTISAWLRLLMSSEVQAKCTNSSPAAAPGIALMRSLRKYSTALTSWLVVASMALTRSASASAKPEAIASSEAEVAASKGPNSGTPGSAARRCSQRTSTSTRKRIRPNSLKIGRRLAVLAP